MSDPGSAAAPSSGIVSEVVADFKNFIASAESFFTGTAWPFVKTFFLSLVESELTMIEPLAVQAAQKVESELGLLFTNPGDFIKFFNATVAELWTLVQGKGLAVAETSILTAAHAAIANLLASKAPA